MTITKYIAVPTDQSQWRAEGVANAIANAVKAVTNMDAMFDTTEEAAAQPRRVGEPDSNISFVKVTFEDVE